MKNGDHMKKRLLLLLTLLVLVIFTAPAVSALSITADGDLSDWGLAALSGPSSDWTKNETWVPTNSQVAFIIENNNNILHKLSPGYYASGVHLTGSKNSYQFYNEPLGILKANGDKVNEPYGGKRYDVSAIYLAQDSSNIYLAVISAMPQAGFLPGHDEQPSDLAMHFKSDPAAKFGWEYGVKLGTYNAVGKYNPGDIVYLPDWQDRGYLLPATPDVMKSPALTGGGVIYQLNPGTQFAYTSNWIDHTDHGCVEYVIELAIPKSVVGAGNVGLSNFLITENCQNDNIYIPEFPTIAVSIGAILGIVFVIYTVRKKNP